MIEWPSEVRECDKRFDGLVESGSVNSDGIAKWIQGVRLVMA